MAGNISDYLENAILNHIFNKSSYSAPTIYLAISNSGLSDVETGSTLDLGKEIKGNGYIRKATLATDWTVAAGGQLSNVVDLTFNTPTGSWGTASGLALLDASGVGAGNVLWWGQLAQQFPITTGMTVLFPSGQLTFSLD
jgi:hypothetical protein